MKLKDLLEVVPSQQYITLFNKRGKMIKGCCMFNGTNKNYPIINRFLEVEVNKVECIALSRMQVSISTNSTE